MPKAYCFSLFFFFTSVGHSYAKHIAALKLLTSKDLGDWGWGTEASRTIGMEEALSLKCELGHLVTYSWNSVLSYPSIHESVPL